MYYSKNEERHLSKPKRARRNNQPQNFQNTINFEQAIKKKNIELII